MKAGRVLTQPGPTEGFLAQFWHSRGWEEGKTLAGKWLSLFESMEDLVGAGRFERPTPCAQGRCATRLRYAPTFC